MKLRNQVAQEMGYGSYFALKVADYGMTVDEMMKLLDDALATTRPIYDALHCWAKGQLGARYRRPTPRLIPAHWLGNRWAQTWPGLVEAANLDPLFKGASAETMIRSAEAFYVSLGFPKLSHVFWEQSDLYPVPPGVSRKKNTHASAWHVDRGQDVRSLMSVEANEQWFGTAHHELGHIYYFLAYSRPEVPFILREGANRAFHEAIGELAKLASQQTPYLLKVGVMPQGKEPDPTGWLMQSALDSIVFLAWSAGTMSHFERDLYETDLAPDEWQRRWWDYVAEFQGVTPPAGREGDLCDACTKTHINDDAAEYYDYALATLIKFQLHDHICTQDPQAGRARVRLHGEQGGRRVPEGDPVRGRDPRLARGDQGGDGGADLAPRPDELLRPAHRRAGEAQHRKGLWALMADKRKPSSPLVAAAESFDEALRRFAALTDGLRRGALDSQRNLERAGESLNEIAACEQDLQAQAQALMTALGAARDAQQTQADAVRARAEDIQKRTEDYAGLMRRFEVIGKDAAALNATAQELAARTRTAEEMVKDGELLAGLDELQAADDRGRRRR